MKKGYDIHDFRRAAWFCAYDNFDEIFDNRTGEANATRIAELAADDLGLADYPGILDDETHPLWDIAVDVAKGVEAGTRAEEMRRARIVCGIANNHRRRLRSARANLLRAVERGVSR